MFEGFYWLDSHGDGTNPVPIDSCPSVMSDSDAPCRPGGRCKKRYATSSLEKGHASKLKCAMMEQLWKLDDWDCVDKRGNPVASPVVQGYLSFVKREQRRVGVGVKHAPSTVAVQLRGLVQDMS